MSGNIIYPPMIEVLNYPTIISNIFSRVTGSPPLYQAGVRDVDGSISTASPVVNFWRSHRASRSLSSSWNRSLEVIGSRTVCGGRGLDEGLRGGMPPFSLEAPEPFHGIHRIPSYCLHDDMPDCNSTDGELPSL